jgi:hypothetical protein
MYDFRSLHRGRSERILAITPVAKRIPYRFIVIVVGVAKRKGDQVFLW